MQYMNDNSNISDAANQEKQQVLVCHDQANSDSTRRLCTTAEV